MEIILKPTIKDCKSITKSCFPAMSPEGDVAFLNYQADQHSKEKYSASRVKNLERRDLLLYIYVLEDCYTSYAFTT